MIGVQAQSTVSLANELVESSSELRITESDTVDFRVVGDGARVTPRKAAYDNP